MVHQIKTSFQRSQGTLLQDALGLAALTLMLLAALSVPGFFF